MEVKEVGVTNLRVFNANSQKWNLKFYLHIYNEINNYKLYIFSS